MVCGEKMTDTLELKAMILKKGMTATSLAESIGLSYQSLSYKINNKREFKAIEIENISTVLGLTLEEKNKIFFGR